MLSLIEFALYIAYIYFSFLRRRLDRQGIEIIFYLSSLIAAINFIQVIFTPKTPQNLLSIILSIFIAVVFGINAKKYYDMMD